MGGEVKNEIFYLASHALLSSGDGSCFADGNWAILRTASVVVMRKISGDNGQYEKMRFGNGRQSKLPSPPRRVVPPRHPVAFQFLVLVIGEIVECEVEL